MNLPADVIKIIETLENAGFEAYAVGGCVRDTLLSKEPKDWDITTSAKPLQVKELFKRTIDTGLQHGTVTVMLNHVGYEVTTYRIDGEYEDARHPKEVIFTPDLKEDLRRRDFTINAMAYSPAHGLVDLFDGAGDLKRGIIRCVGDPEERFTEDALRMLRAVRFSAQLGFEIEENTAAAVRKLAPNIEKISAERIAAETVKTITSDHPEYFEQAYSLGLTRHFLPEFDIMMQTPQNSKHHIYDVGHHTLVTLCNIPADRVLRLTMLLHDVAKPATISVDAEGHNHFYGHPEKGAQMARDILKRLKLDNETIDRVCSLIRFHDDRTPVSLRTMRRSLNRMGEGVFPDLFAVKRADIAGQSQYHREEKLRYVEELEAAYHTVMEEGQCFDKKDLAIGGRELLKLGFPQGKAIGACLDRLLELVLEDPSLNTKERLTSLAMQMKEECE